VTEHNVEDASCDTSDLAAPPPVESANLNPNPNAGCSTTDTPGAPPQATRDAQERQREEDGGTAAGGSSLEAGPLALEGLQMDDRLVAWQPAPAADASASTNPLGVAPTPAAARANLSSGAGGVEMQELRAGGAADVKKVGTDSGGLCALQTQTESAAQSVEGDLVLATTQRPL